MARPARCSICHHKQAANINAALAAGQSNRSISKTYKMTPRTVAKHIAEKHPGYEKPAVIARPVAARSSENDTPESRLRGLIAQLEQSTVDASGPIRPELARELRMAYSDLAKISDATPNAVTVADVEGLPELLKDLFVALEPFAEARAAMADVLRARMALNDDQKEQANDQA